VAASDIKPRDEGKLRNRVGGLYLSAYRGAAVRNNDLLNKIAGQPSLVGGMGGGLYMMATINVMVPVQVTQNKMIGNYAGSPFGEQGGAMAFTQIPPAAGLVRSPTTWWCPFSQAISRHGPRRCPTVFGVSGSGRQTVVSDTSVPIMGDGRGGILHRGVVRWPGGRRACRSQRSRRGSRRVAGRTGLPQRPCAGRDDPRVPLGRG
jgi:hypothetical protein